MSFEGGEFSGTASSHDSEDNVIHVSYFLEILIRSSIMMKGCSRSMVIHLTHDRSGKFFNAFLKSFLSTRSVR